MNRYLKTLLLLAIPLVSAGITLTACEDKEKPEYEWEWGGDDTPNTEKPRYIWVDAAANFPDFANSKENILRDLTLAKEAGFTDIVVDVRPTTGDVLFETDVEQQVEWLGAWLPGGYTKIERTATWDYLQAFIDAGHSLGLKIHAGVNTMVGGNRTSLGPSGLLFRDASKAEWATQLLTENGIVSTLEGTETGSRFFNPVHEEVQSYLLDMLADLAAYQELDGIILDRGRFDDLDSDFSEYTRLKFEEYIGHSITNFPDDIMPAGTAVGNLPNPQPPYFKRWLEFRVKTIHDFMEKARNRVKGVNPDISFGVYVGGWYSTYYNVGVNWASPRFNTSNAYSTWASTKYHDYGYADLMDVILIGAYASPTSVHGSSEWTIEGFTRQAMNKIKGDAKVVGGPDIGNGQWATAADDVINNAIRESVPACMNAGDGYFLFDMIHLKLKPHQWDYVKQGIDKALAED